MAINTEENLGPMKLIFPDFVTFARLSKGTIEYQGISNICG